MILQTIDWKEYHPNGEKWITGQIGIVGDMWKHLYDYRTGFPGYEGKPVCRLGLWKKYYDNGQLAWTMDYGTGMYGCHRQDFPSYRRRETDSKTKQ